MPIPSRIDSGRSSVHRRMCAPCRFFLYWLLLLVGSQFATASATAEEPSQAARQEQQPPPQLQLLEKAYDGAFEPAYSSGRWGAQFPDGTFIPWDDGIEHESYEDLLARPNLKDIFLHPYPALRDGDNYQEIGAPLINIDPGRIRHQGFFQALYGDTRDEIEGQLASVNWMPNADSPGAGTALRVHSGFDIPGRVRRISERLEELPEEYLPFLLPPAGAWFWREIFGTNRLSMHSYGIAIDINPAYGTYWLWDSEYHYDIQLPLEIVKIFESEGFIWGGRWYHYDSFHFEFRPELLISR